MDVTTHQALSTLHATGRITLPGAPAAWSSTLLVLFFVLMGLIGLVTLGVVVGLPIAVAAGVDVTVFTVFGLLGVLGAFAALMLLLRHGVRAQKAYRDQERQNVTIDAKGLTLRGVGPVPWADFGTAEYRMVPAERNSGRVRRAVMELTDSGKAAVNQHLHPALRKRLSPPIGPMWNRHHRYIYLPGIAGMSEKDVMYLINTARGMIGVPRAQGAQGFG